MNAIHNTKPSAKVGPFEQGANAAAWLRAQTNNLTDTARDDLMARGMQIIYGGNGTKVPTVRR